VAVRCQGRDGCFIVSPSDPIPQKRTEADKCTQPPHRQAANHHRRAVKDKDGDFLQRRPPIGLRPSSRGGLEPGPLPWLDLSVQRIR
jgi:hypothetical protein